MLKRKHSPSHHTLAAMGFNVSVTIEINTYPMVPSVFFSLVSTLEVNYNSRSWRQQIDIYHGDNSVSRTSFFFFFFHSPTHHNEAKALWRQKWRSLSVQGNNDQEVVKFLFSPSAKKHVVLTQKKRGLIFHTF